MNIETVRKLLIAYSEYLEKYGYMDTDWWIETPNTVERFIKSMGEIKK